MKVLNSSVTRSRPLVFNSGRRFRLIFPKPNVYHSSKSQASTGFSENNRRIEIPLSEADKVHFGGIGISFPGFEEPHSFASLQINSASNTFTLESLSGKEISIGDFAYGQTVNFSLKPLEKTGFNLSVRSDGYEYDLKVSVEGEQLVLYLQEYTSAWNDSEKLEQLKGVDQTLTINNFTADQIKAWKLFAQVPEFWDFPIKLHSFQEESVDGRIHDTGIVEKLLSSDFMPVIGDMHANSRKALAFLVLTGRLRMSSIDVAKIIGIFHELENISLREPFDINSINAQIEEITNEDDKIDFTKLKLEDSDPLVVEIKEYRRQIKEILDRAEWKGGKVLFLGDVISDRWGFDFPMMDLIERFKDNLIVLLSNHDLIGARLLIENNLYDPEKPKQQVSTLRDLMVFPLAKVLKETKKQLSLRKLALIGTEAKILFTHAPVSEKILTDFFKHWATSYRREAASEVTEINPDDIKSSADISILFEQVEKWYKELVAAAFISPSPLQKFLQCISESYQKIFPKRGAAEFVEETTPWKTLWSQEFLDFVGARPGKEEGQYKINEFPYRDLLKLIVCGHHSYQIPIPEVLSMDQGIGRPLSVNQHFPEGSPNFVNSIFLLPIAGLQSVSQ